LVPDPEWIRIQNLQNGIGSGLKKIRFRTPQLGGYYLPEMITIWFCRLDIQQDSEFATGYGYPKSVLKQVPDTDPYIRNAFIDISRILTFGKSCTLHNHSFIIFIQKHLFSHLCHDSESVYGVFCVS